MLTDGIEGDILLQHHVIAVRVELFFQMLRRILIQSSVDLTAHFRDPVRGFQKPLPCHILSDALQHQPHTLFDFLVIHTRILLFFFHGMSALFYWKSGHQKNIPMCELHLELTQIISFCHSICKDRMTGIQSLHITIEMFFIWLLQRVRISYRKTCFSFPRQLPILGTLDA